jgi:hypothetical protein
MSEEDKPEEKPDDKGKPEFKAPANQEEFDRMVADRLTRERSKFADYDDLKAKATKFDEVAEADKSEVQKATERAAAAEQRAAVAEQTALKTRIAAEMNVPIEVLHGDNEESIRAAAQKVLDWAGSTKKTPPAVKSLKSGAAGEDTSGMTGKQRAAAALRAMQGGS